MDFNISRIVVMTGLRLVGAAVLAGAVGVLIGWVFFEEESGTQVYLKSTMTQAEYEQLRSQCSQLQTPSPDAAQLTEESVLTREAIALLCEQLEAAYR